MTQQTLDEIWKHFLETGQCEKGFACISNGRLHHITEYASDKTWERNRSGPEWKLVFPIRRDPEIAPDPSKPSPSRNGG